MKTLFKDSDYRPTRSIPVTVIDEEAAQMEALAEEEEEERPDDGAIEIASSDEYHG